MEYYVADSYKNMDRVGEPIKKNGRLYTVVEGKCDRCGGTGVFACRVENGHPVPHPAYGGVCLKCNGEGKITKTVRLYSKSEHEAAQKAKANRRIQKVIETTQRIEKRKSEALGRWLKWNGFDPYGDTFIVYGNTYPIKDDLKADGYKFSKELMWHGPRAVCVPEDCFVERINWTDVYKWNDELGRMEITEEGRKFLNDIFSKNALGIYIGEIGERLRDVPVIFEKMITFDGKYGESHVYKFNSEGAQISWFTTCIKDLEEGARYTLTGTVKKHEIYGNVKTTYLNRCIIK